MIEKYVDLHLHTTASDGSFSPTEVVKLAKKRGLSTIAITDHDTIDGVCEAKKAGERFGVEVIAGIEMNTDYDNAEIHILGYYLDYTDQMFLKKLSSLKEARYNRIKEIVYKLKSLGMEIEFSEVEKLAQGGVLGRPHIAQVMVEKSYVNSWSVAFDEYIGRQGSAYVERKKISPREAIEVIKVAKGVPVLAHPALMERDDLLERLLEWGIEGLEVYHSEHGREDVEKYLKFTRNNGLLITAGSDCHGPKRKGEILIGKIKGNYQIVEGLKSIRRF